MNKLLALSLLGFSVCCMATVRLELHTKDGLRYVTLEKGQKKLLIDYTSRTLSGTLKGTLIEENLEDETVDIDFEVKFHHQNSKRLTHELCETIPLNIITTLRRVGFMEHVTLRATII